MVEKPSHEKGLLVSFSGAAPALGSRLIDGEGRLIGIVDSVLGKVEEPLLHLKMKLQADPAQMVGLDLEIQSRNKSWDDRKRDSRGSRDDRGGRGDQRGRDDRGSRDDRSSGDWFCRKCSNSNFSFRTECNRCNAPKPGGRDDGRGERRGGRDERRGGRDDRGRHDRSGGDWDCPKCNNSNFSFRTECNRCNAPRGGRDSGGSRGGERGSRRGERRGERRGPHQERYDRGDRNDSRERRNDNRGENDWTCSQCNNSNFAFRTECNRCNASKGGGGGSSRGSPRGGERGSPRGGDRGGSRGGERGSGQRGARRDGRRGPSQRGSSGRIFKPRKPKNEPRHNSNRKNPSNPFRDD
ncbi:MAG: hypothetical protein HN696_01200 [Euryarchaeota archaeon]|nr:hypothetical protein [Euryarchaeota archaeon]